MHSILKRFIGIFSVFFYSSAFGDFLPPNDLYLQDKIGTDTGITEEEFNQVIDQAVAIYEPIIKEHGATLIIRRLWSNNTVNASANQSGEKWYVNMYGGLARREEITVDGFAMVVCHELGHHLGGFPYYQGRWAANEGQSDYFAALSCAPYLWEDEEEINATFRQTVDEYSKDLCDRVYSTEARQNLCYRQMAANLSIAGLLAALRNTKIDYKTPDTSVVSRTYDRHPKAQCRLDTYKEATLCVAEWDINIIPKTEEDSADYTCTRSQDYTIGTRPHCWFKENL